MSRRHDQPDPYADDNGDFYYEDDYASEDGAEYGYITPASAPHHATHDSTYDSPSLPAPALVPQAFDWGISGSILAIMLLTFVYVLSPLDIVPDLVPVAGQVDDLVAILAGGGSISFLAVLRYVLRSRIGRVGCLIAIVFSSIGAFAVFWVIMQILDRIL